MDQLVSVCAISFQPRVNYSSMWKNHDRQACWKPIQVSDIV